METADLKNSSVPEMIANLDLYGLIEDMAQNPSMQAQRAKDIDYVLQTIIGKQKQNAVYREAVSAERKGETVLHTAIKRLQFTSAPEKEVFECLVDTFPKLLFQDRLATEYAGQTPLHMAVTKGNIWVANTLLTSMSKKEHKARKPGMLKRLAVGAVFTNTVMMAELPLSIAAVTCNKGMFDLLIEYDAELDGTNRHGDNACHSLIRYALLYPEKLQDVLDMCKYLSEDPAPYDNSDKAMINRKLRKKVWLMDNQDGYNPLQLAAKFGQHEIFTFIMNLDVYCCENVNDGLFDIKIYDVTEIDAISYMSTKERTGLDTCPQIQTSIEDVPERKAVPTTKYSCQRSILQMLLQLEPGCAFQFLLFPPLRRIIDNKWRMYRWYFYPWFIFHLIYMCLLTWYGIERSQQHKNDGEQFDIHKDPNYKIDMFHDDFGVGFGSLNIVVGSWYVLEALLRLIMGHMPWTIRSFTNPYGNGTFQVMFVLFGLLLIVDIPLAIWVRSYENYLLIVAIVIGWFLFLFFLRALRPFSFFTVMIQKVLIGDLFRFSVILCCELVGFSTAMHMAIQGASESDEEFDNFGRALLSMFKLMVGLGEMGLFYKARHPVLVILIFVTFIILTTILMINSLIAMLSRTCTELVENVGTVSARDMHWKLQRLSMVLYIESILPKCAVKCVGKKQETSRFNNQTNKRNVVTRYMMEIRSLQNEDRSEKEDTISASWGFRTAQFNAVLHKQAWRLDRPLSGVRNTFNNLMHRGKKHKERKDGSKKETRSPAVERDEKEKEAKVIAKQTAVSENNATNVTENVNYGKINQVRFDPSPDRSIEDYRPGFSEDERESNQLSAMRNVMLYVQPGSRAVVEEKHSPRRYIQPSEVHPEQRPDPGVQPQRLMDGHKSPREQLPIGRQSPEKLEIYYISRCKQCSGDESFA